MNQVQQKFSVPCSTAEDVDAAVQAANNAFDAWSQTEPAERAKYMEKIADLIDENLG